MRQPVSAKVARTLRDLAKDAPLELRISGDCMAPLLESGAMVRVIRQPFYWPGDPLVVHAPANVIGMFTDFFQRTITDVGSIGPDRARGGPACARRPPSPGRAPGTRAPARRAATAGAAVQGTGPGTAFA